MSQYRTVIEQQEKEITIDVLADQRLCGLGIQGRTLIERMNEILPYHSQLDPEKPSGYKGGNIILQAVANTALDQMEEDGSLGKTKIRTALPEDLIPHLNKGPLAETWYDWGLVWWGEKGTNSQHARDLANQVKKATSLILSPPMILYGLRAERDENSPSQVRFVYKEGKTKILNTYGWKKRNKISVRKIQNLDDIVYAHRRNEGMYFADTERNPDIAIQPISYAYGAINIRGASLSDERFFQDRNLSPRLADEGRLILVVESQKD